MARMVKAMVPHVIIAERRPTLWYSLNEEFFSSLKSTCNISMANANLASTSFLSMARAFSLLPLFDSLIASFLAAI